MRFLISDEHNPSSILSCIRSARENSRTLREVLPAAGMGAHQQPVSAGQQAIRGCGRARTRR